MDQWELEILSRQEVELRTGCLTTLLHCICWDIPKHKPSIWEMSQSE